MALTPERMATMRVFAETALEADLTVPVGPRTLLALLDAAELHPFATIHRSETLDALPLDSVMVVVGPTGLVEVFHKQMPLSGEAAWYTAGVSRKLQVSEVPLPATLVFIPQKHE